MCLASSYMTGYMYQENILPLYHKHFGAEVRIVANCIDYIDGKVNIIPPGNYYDNDIEIVRIPFRRYHKYLDDKIRRYRGFKREIEVFKPDIIFVHDAQFYNTHEIRNYVSANNKVKVIVDCHTDEGNSAKGKLSKIFLHKIYYKWRISILDSVVKRWWGVLPQRVHFLTDYYDIDIKKIGYLPLGYDDLNLFNAPSEQMINEIPKEYYVFCGRMDKRKEIFELLTHWKEYNTKMEESNYLLLIGPIIDNRIDLFIKENQEYFRHIEWAAGNALTTYLYKSKGVLFPGTHSTLWEWAMGMGKIIYTRRNYYEGLNIDNMNIKVLESSMRDYVDDILSNRSINNVFDMKDYNYSNIAKKALTW